MSRIQTILDKAEREGTARRFRSEQVDREGRGWSEPAERPEPPPAGTAHDPHRVTADESADRVSGPPPPHVARTAQTTVFEPVERLAPVDAVGTVDRPAASESPTEPVRDDDGVSVSDRQGISPPRPEPARHRSPVAPALVAALHPNALASEQFRTLRTRIANSANGRGARALLLTSPGRGEGKSVMAANLALTMGQEIQQRVCLVDASLRDACVHELFGLPDSPGLVDVLNGDATLDDALVSIEEYQLSVLPAGRLPRHPAELLAGREMRRVLDELRSRFDRVVIDAPPAMPMADVSILAPLVDGVLMVVRAGMTDTPGLQRALAGLDASRVLGVVLNDIQA